MDAVLCLMLVVLAWRTLAAERLYQSAILFIAFGLAMALAWTRLAAPDVALAEAAIGTGLLGVLLMDSLRVFAESPGRGEGDGSGFQAEGPAEVRARRSLEASLPVALTCLALACVTVAAALSLPGEGGLAEEAGRQLGRSGVEHPVTAVLLNFRAFDTWLELGVMLLAMLGLFCVGGRIDFADGNPPDPPGPVLGWFIRTLVPVMVLAAVYLLWLGKDAPGGAFQSGVVLGAAGILLRLAGFPLMAAIRPGGALLLLAAGFAAFLAAGLLTLPRGGAFLEYPEETAGAWILLVEGVAAVSIGFTVFAFFAYLNSRPRSLDGARDDPPPSPAP